MRRCAIATAFIGVAFAGGASAEPQRFSTVGDRLYFDATVPFPGETSRSIGTMDASELVYHLEHSLGIRTVMLTATGGSMEAGDDMADVLSKYGVDTEVQGRCLSACVLVFLGGKHRSLARGSVLGFHRSYVEVPSISVDVANEYDRGEVAALRSVKFMLDHGVDVRFALKALTYERGDMWMPSRAELTLAGVLTAP